MTSRCVALLSCGVLTLMGFAAASLSAAEEAKTKEVEVREITLSVPETWKSKEVSGFRVAQFEVPAVEGDKEAAEVVIFHFGKTGGGGVEANIERWTKQFEAEGRKRSIADGESKQGAYTLVDLTGTWNKPVGPPVLMKTTKMAGARMLSVILHSKDGGDFFIRLTGPEKTVAESAKAFRASFGADPEKEKSRDEDKK